MKSGIYALWFEEPQMVYIGQAVDITRRFTKHKHLLRKGTHPNYKIYKNYLKFGYPELVVLEYCSIKQLDELEITWMDESNSIVSGLNLISGGTENANRGINSPTSKYSKWKVLRVFSRLKNSDLTGKDIAVKESVTEPFVYSISLGNSHAWIKETYPKAFNTMRDHRDTLGSNRKSKYYEKFPVALDMLANTNKTQTEISEILHIPRHIIVHLLNSKEYLWVKEEFPELYAEAKNNTKKLSRNCIKDKKLVNIDGQIVTINNLTQFCKDNFPENIEKYRKYLGEVINRKRTTYLGWSLYE